MQFTVKGVCRDAYSSKDGRTFASIEVEDKAVKGRSERVTVQTKQDASGKIGTPVEFTGNAQVKFIMEG